ncbi:STAS domain-containing protein [Prauserella cavernicola]|uniref:Anti-sigma factor antagonist n=1 Tax=Prauserella cavernicola TaxID=2800127 RepID=A0A934V3R6_9PSEU|nr:STAS domain-containing protein [Prauserella cavernicola]MBK1783325.1 STAS domain-containing protein [Prauserella cavernicola]
MPAPDPYPNTPSPSPGESGVTVRPERRGDAVVLRVTGELDLMSSPVLDGHVATALEEPPPPLLVIDLSGVSFLASSGMASLVAAQQAAGESTTLRVVATGRATARALEVVGLDQQLPVHASLEEALAEGR